MTKLPAMSGNEQLNMTHKSRPEQFDRLTTISEIGPLAFGHNKNLQLNNGVHEFWKEWVNHLVWQEQTLRLQEHVPA